MIKQVEISSSPSSADTSGEITSGEGSSREGSSRVAKSRVEGFIRKKFVAEFAILAIYVCLLIVLGWHHEPWRDEADIWLVGRDNSLLGIWQLAAYTGSPILWQAMVSALAKVGLPYQSMHVLNGLFAVAAAAIVLFRAPFSITLKAVLLFSYLLSYEYAIVARSYQLSVLIILALASMHAKRFQNPIVYATLVGLLANTNAHGLIIAASITAVNGVEILLKRLPSATLFKFSLPAVFGIVLSVVQLWQPKDGQLNNWTRVIEWQPLVVAMREAFVPMTSNINHCLKPGLGYSVIDDLMIVPAAIAIAAVFWRIRRSWYAMGTLAFTWIGLFCLFELIYLGYVRHWGFLFVAAIYAIWVAELDSPDNRKDSASNRNNRPSTVLRSDLGLLLALSISTFTAVNAWILEVQKPFSGSAAVATFINESTSKSKLPIAAYRCFAGEAILPYLSSTSQLFYVEQNRFGSHMLWNDKTMNLMNEEQLFSAVNTQFGSESRLLLVAAPYRLKSAKSRGFRCIFKTPVPITTDERFFVYYRRGGSTSSAVTSGEIK